MNYLHWDEKIITNFSDIFVKDLYNNGFVFTRIGKGVMQQTRSVRIDLNSFTPSSENRRVIKKVSVEAGISISAKMLPLKDYSWEIGKLAKDFYSDKFGGEDGLTIMSAQKIKEMLTDEQKSNFNTLLAYTNKNGDVIGYAICYQNNSIVHYSYPFYDVAKAPKDMGLGMMNLAIIWAKNSGKKYFYLGSLQRPGDVYKLQFVGLEWFDGKDWKHDMEEVKTILKVTT